MMNFNISISSLILLITLLFTLGACGPRAYIKGDYDQDINEANLLMDKWSESDMQKAVQYLVQSALSHRAIKAAKRPPVVMVTKLQNKTSEHIDTQNIMDMIRVELMRSGNISFVDKAAREDIQKEYDYQASGAVSEETQKKRGGQIGTDYIINGRLDAITQQTGRVKTIYYKLTLNLTNLKTSQILWSDYKQIRKRYKKRRIGL